MNRKISIVICTTGRPTIKETIRSIKKNTYREYEIVIVHQGNIKMSFNLLNEKIKYFHLSSYGLSKARNLGVSQADGEIIAFIDDDCLADRRWLKEIYSIFAMSSDISGVFGAVLPYHPHEHVGEVCPILFTHSNKRRIKHPCYHASSIGYGNNMAYLKNEIKKLGGFKEWLGINSVGQSAEDAEMALRMLVKGKALFYNPKMKLYHNRWLSPKDHKKQQLAYICGEVACYGYFYFKKHKFAKKILVENYKKNLTLFRNCIKRFAEQKKEAISDLIYLILIIFSQIRGVFIAIFYLYKDQLNK